VLTGNDTGYDTWKGHTLGTPDQAPGGTFTPDATAGLECVDCYHQHGSTSSGKDVKNNPVTSAYRNLKTFNTGGISVSYAVGTNDLTKDVFEQSAAKGASHYDVTNIDFNEPDSTRSGYGEWCKQCHTDFHGGLGDANMGGDADRHNWLRHPTAGVDVGGQDTHGHSNLARAWAATGRTNWVKVMSETGNWSSTSTDVTPSCMTCHKAHGNKNPFGLIYMEGTGANVTEEGDDGVTNGRGAKNLCKQCHIQG
jgi:hypothetical protein